MFKVIGVVIIALALVLAIVPAFTDCESQGKVITLDNGKEISMKCHWTGRAEVAVAVPLAIAGIMMILGRRRTNLMNLSILATSMGLMAILLPTALIGVCMTPTMTCVTAMKATLLSAGGVTIALGVFGVVWSRLSKALT